jgi:hypothetical protein
MTRTTVLPLRDDCCPCLSVRERQPHGSNHQSPIHRPTHRSHLEPDHPSPSHPEPSPRAGNAPGDGHPAQRTRPDPEEEARPRDRRPTRGRHITRLTAPHPDDASTSPALSCSRHTSHSHVSRHSPGHASAVGVGVGSTRGASAFLSRPRDAPSFGAGSTTVVTPGVSSADLGVSSADLGVFSTTRGSSTTNGRGVTRGGTSPTNLRTGRGDTGTPAGPIPVGHSPGPNLGVRSGGTGPSARTPGTESSARTSGTGPSSGRSPTRSYRPISPASNPTAKITGASSAANSTTGRRLACLRRLASTSRDAIHPTHPKGDHLPCLYRSSHHP